MSKKTLKLRKKFNNLSEIRKLIKNNKRKLITKKVGVEKAPQ